MNSFVDILNEQDEFLKLCEAVGAGRTPAHVVGVSESQKAHLAFGLAQKLERRLLVVCASDALAQKLCGDLAFFDKNVVHIPAKELVFYNVDATDREIMHKKMLALSRLETCSAAVMSIESLLQFVMPKNILSQELKTLRVGENLEMEPFLEYLVRAGYTRVDMVEGVGQFSVRGGIVDVYSPAADAPLRLELFDTEIDSIRTFDVFTQLSTEKVDSAGVIPVSDSGQTGSITSYIPEDMLVFFDEPARLHERYEAILWDIGQTVSDLLEKGAITEAKDRYINTLDEVMADLSENAIIGLSSLSHQTPDFKPRALFEMTVKILQSYGGKIAFLMDDLKYWMQRRYRIIVLAGSKSRCESLLQLLSDQQLEGTYYDELYMLPPRGTVCVTHGSLSKGFEYPLINTVVVSDREIFPSEKKKRTRAISKKDAIKDYSELNVGDFVVHAAHGIGQYLGLSHIETQGITKDYIKIQYKGEDVLYLPVDQLDKISKYKSGDAEKGRGTKLSKLGGAEWKNTKSRVKQSVLELAKKLVELYAERNRQKGHAFSPDTTWQRQFEDEFIYEETPDQLQSIAEMKKDMESPRPMDRLLCGDVGFGKTEVAIRGAFKCVMDGMQVAYLVPTTILAAQHYHTFSQRMKNYPIKVEMLSRFKSAAEQKQIIKKLATGEVDVVIGTHRLLQKDVKYKDLGLLIIDEEQRFGVAHKEKIKEMKTNVDVLTLSATPIPRSLHMAMIGIRDMSVLTQPPEDRYPVQTYVMEYNEAIIADAIKREIERGGQVFYLHNRVGGIHLVAERIQKMVPEAQIEVAHGQMNETQLENVMMRVMEGEINVLVCTTIIETGLDVSNANTMIIENADHMGLAQLYQLRGRVGRSNRLAYAYLTYKKDKVLQEVSEKRLRAIKEFTEFGSGFKIALRDLELRGAGNVLGPEQHGFMASVGYDVYCQLLDEAVREVKGEKTEEKKQTVMDLNMNAFIPEKYIKNANQRIEMYKKIAAIGCLSDRYQVEEELEDRYGDPPKEVRCLVDIAYLKTEAASCGVIEIGESGQNVLLYLDAQEMAGMLEQIGLLIGTFQTKILLNAGKKPYLSFKKPPGGPEEILTVIKNILEGLKKG